MSNPQSLDSDVDVLAGISFFAGFSKAQLKLIAISAESRSLPEKLLLFDEGQLLHSAYVIVSGTLRGEHKVPNSDRVERREIGPGVLLGERALVLDARAAESVRVETRNRVLQIRNLMFRKLLQEHPEMAAILRSRLTRHVVSMASGLNVVAERLRAIRL
jgi:CRP-like cAMP-binding protein